MNSFIPIPAAKRLSRLRWRVAGALVAGAMPLLAQATVTVVNKFLPNPVYPGQATEYSLQIWNDSATPLTDADLTSLFPPGLKAESILSDTCGFSTSVVLPNTGVAGSDPGIAGVYLKGGSVPPKTDQGDGECTVTVRASTLLQTNLDAVIPKNTAPTASVSGFSARENNAQVYANTDTKVTLSLLHLSPPTGNKSFQGPAYEGAPFPLTITLSNPNEKYSLALTSFADQLPKVDGVAQMQVANPPNGTVTCAGGQLGATAGASQVTLTGGTIPPNGSCTLTVDVVVPSLGGKGKTQFSNQVPAGAIGNAHGLTSEPFYDNVDVQPALALSKSFANGIVPINVPTKMTITITNNGVVPLTNASFTDTFPAGMQLASPVSVTSACGTVSANTAGAGSLVFTGGSVPAATRVNGVATPGKCVVTANVLMTKEGKLTNELPVNAIRNNENIGSPAASAALQAYAKLQVEKSVAPANVAPGEWAQFSIKVKNYSGQAVTGASITDDLVSPMVLDMSLQPSGCGASFAPNGLTNVDGGNQLLGTNATIPQGSGVNPGECTVTFRARVPSTETIGKTFKNALPVGAVGVGSMVNTDPAEASITTVAAVVLAKSFAGSTTVNGVPAVAQGQSATLALDIYNRYASDLSNITLQDNLVKLGEGITLAADPQPTNTCGGTLDARPYATTLTLSGAKVAARSGTSHQQSCRITVQVVGKLPGTFTNQISGQDDFSSNKPVKPADVSAKLTVYAGLTGSKSFKPSAVQSGAVTRVTVSIKNGTNAQQTNVTMVDDGFSAGLVVANPANASTTCGGSASVTANPGAASVHLAGAVVPAGASCDVSFDAQTSGNGPWSNTIPAGKITSAEGAYNSDPIRANLSTSSVALGLGKVFSETKVQGNAPTVLTLSLINNSNVPMSGVSVSDAFPEGMLVYSVPGISTTCKGATVAAKPGDKLIAVSGAEIPASDYCEVKVTVTSSKFLNLTNTVPAGAMRAAGGYTNGQPASATVTTLEGLGVSKGFEPATIVPGKVSRLTITLMNTFSPTTPTLHGVSFTDKLPTGLVVAANPNASTTCMGGEVTTEAGTDLVTLTKATLSQNQLCVVQVDVTAATKGSFTNEIPVGGVTTDEKVTNVKPGQATLEVDDGPDVEKNFDPKEVAGNQPTILTVVVTNNASKALTGVSLADNLPAGLSIANPANASTTCTGGSVHAPEGGTTVTLSGATVGVGKSCKFSVAVLSATAGEYKNTIGKDALTSHQGLTNGNPTESTVVVLPPPSVAKSFTPVQIASNGISQLAIHLMNTTDKEAKLNKDLADALPTNLFVAAAANINAASTKPASALEQMCDASKVAISEDRTRITYAKGAVIPAGGCSFWLDVTATHSGAYLNKIDAGQLDTSLGVNAEPAVATIGVDKPALPTVSKSFSQSVITPGESVRLTIVMNNPNAGELELTSDLVDNFPASMVVADPHRVSSTCPTTPSVAAGDTKIVYPENAKLPPNGGCSISVDVTSSQMGPHVNKIDKGKLQTTGGSNPEETTAGITVVPTDDPTVLKKFDPASVPAFGTTRLTITLGNPSSKAATLTQDLRDTFPLMMVTADPPHIGGTCANFAAAPGITVGNDYVQLPAGSKIPASSTCTIEVDVVANILDSTLTNTIPQGGLVTDLGVNGVDATADLIVSPGPAPSVGKGFADNEIAPGKTTVMAITLVNLLNPEDAVLQADMVDNFPAGLSIASLEPVPEYQDFLCPTPAVAQVGGTSVTYPKGAIIPANGFCVIAVHVTASSPGVYTNVIAAGALDTTLGKNPAPVEDTLTVLPTTSLASLSGNVYHDRDDDGLIAPVGEEGVGGVTVILEQVTSSGVRVLTTTVTKPDGSYVFPDLPPGDGYQVKMVQPSGWFDGKDTAGSHGGSNATANLLSGVSLQPGDNATQYNFGLHKAASLSGTVFVDPTLKAASSGFEPGKDKGLGGVTIELLKGGQVVATATTAVEDMAAGELFENTLPDGTVLQCKLPEGGLLMGQYHFCNLPAGSDYAVRETQPAGYISTGNKAGDGGGSTGALGDKTELIDQIEIGAMEDVKGYDFGEYLNEGSTVVSGRVYEETGKNTVDDGHPGDPGLVTTVSIACTGPGSAAPYNNSMKTKTDGTYSFAGMLPGAQCTITQTQPKGYANAYTQTGTSGEPGKLGPLDESQAGTTTDSVIRDIVVPSSGSHSNNFAKVQLFDLAIVKAVKADEVPLVGSPLVYTLTVSNIGPGNSDGAVVTDKLPEGLVYESSSEGCAMNSGTLTCEVGELAVGAKKVFTVTATIEASAEGTDLVNTATVTSVGDSNPDNNQSSVTVTVGKERPGPSPQPRPVPAMGDAALVLMALAMAGMAGLRLRRRG